MPSKIGAWMAPPLTENDRRKLIDDPGPSWREYFFHHFLRWWIGLAYLVVDVLIVGYWLESGFLVPPGTSPGLADGLAALEFLVPLGAAIYLEYLGYQYLWYEPSAGPSSSVRDAERNRWIYPVAYGRWTTPGERVARGQSPFTGQEIEAAGPDPSEFV